MEAIDFLRQSRQFRKYPIGDERHICWGIAPAKLAEMMEEYAKEETKELKSILEQVLDADMQAPLETSIFKSELQQKIYKALNLIDETQSNP